MIALLLGQGTQTCARKHHLRHSDFRQGRRLGKHDHLIVGLDHNAQRGWMRRLISKFLRPLVLREIRFSIVEPGRRTKSIEIITTLIDADDYSKEDIAELYGFRWNSELDIRSIKIESKSRSRPMQISGDVRSEMWTTMLAYNLIRTTAAGAALLHGKQPRQISFHEHLPIRSRIMDAIVYRKLESCLRRGLSNDYT